MPIEPTTLAIVLGRAVLFVRRQTSVANLEDLVRSIQSKHLAQIELAAARQSFKDALSSTDPKRELALAVGHLQSAYQALEHAKPIIRRTFFFITNEDDSPVIESRELKVPILALITTLYIYLNEQRLSKQYGELYKDAFTFYYHEQRNSILGTVSSFMKQLNLAEKATAQLLEQAGVEYQLKQLLPREEVDYGLDNSSDDDDDDHDPYDPSNPAAPWVV